MEATTDKLTSADILGYLLAYSLWIILSAVAGVALLLIRSVLAPITVLLLAPNPWYQLHTTELGGVANSVDRFGLVVLAIIWVVYMIYIEEYFRSSIAAVRMRRARAALGGGTAGRRSATETRLQRLGLDILARRLPKALLFPLAVFALYFLGQGIIWLIART